MSNPFKQISQYRSLKVFPEVYQNICVSILLCQSLKLLLLLFTLRRQLEVCLLGLNYNEYISTNYAVAWYSTPIFQSETLRESDENINVFFQTFCTASYMIYHISYITLQLNCFILYYIALNYPVNCINYYGSLLCSNTLYYTTFYFIILYLNTICKDILL